MAPDSLFNKIYRPNSLYGKPPFTPSFNMFETFDLYYSVPYLVKVTDDTLFRNVRKCSDFLEKTLTLYAGHINVYKAYQGTVRRPLVLW
jgi:hypothetical protein